MEKIYKFVGNGLKEMKDVQLERGCRIYGVYGFVGSESGTFTVYGETEDRYKIVEIDGEHRLSTCEKFLEPISEEFGIGTYYDDREPDFRFTEEEIEKALKEAEEQKIKDEKEAEEQKIRNEETRKKLLEEYSYLERVDGDSNKTAATNIRTLLKKNFPSIKFSVRKEHYDCYDISWTNGPGEDEVEEITCLFKDHKTDVTGDYRDYSPSIFNKLFGGINYIFLKRYEEEIPEITSSDIDIIDYSEKSIAIVGDTKPIKDLLKSLGCRFNSRLSCGIGWVAPKKQEDIIRKALGK